MLLSSKYHAHAHALKEAQRTGKTLSAPSRTLGLTPEVSHEILETLHKLNVAEGLHTVGRRVIADGLHSAVNDAPRARLGYLYSERLLADEDDADLTISIGRHKHVCLEPKFALHLSEPLEGKSGWEEFLSSIVGISHAWEVLAIPYGKDDWTYDDRVCANGFSRELIVGTSKTLTDKSKQNFNELLSHATFSFSKIQGAASQITGFTTGPQTMLSSIYDAYLLYQQQCDSESTSCAAPGGMLALNSLCKPIRVSAGEEWSFVSTGFGLKTLQIKILK